jgi:hypothetical protein
MRLSSSSKGMAKALLPEEKRMSAAKTGGHTQSNSIKQLNDTARAVVFICEIYSKVDIPPRPAQNSQEPSLANSLLSPSGINRTA